jgi:hypothetical protein
VEMEVGDGITDDIFVNKEPWRLFGWKLLQEGHFSTGSNIE